MALKEEREQERRQTQAQRLREMTSRKRVEKVMGLLTIIRGMHICDKYPMFLLLYYNDNLCCSWKNCSSSWSIGCLFRQWKKMTLSSSMCGLSVL